MKMKISAANNMFANIRESIRRLEAIKTAIDMTDGQARDLSTAIELLYDYSDLIKTKIDNTEVDI